MSTTTSTHGPIPPVPGRRISVDEYHRLIQAGHLTEDDPVELLEGRVVTKMPRNPPHDGTVQSANKKISRVLPAGWDTRVQSAITTADSEPEPDVAVVQGDERSYFHRHPGPADIALLVEVSDSSLDRDRNEKGLAYAAAGIAIYWIINLIDGHIEVYTDPSGPAAAPGYRQRQDFAKGDSVPLVIGGQTIALIAVSDLLP